MRSYRDGRRTFFFVLAFGLVILVPGRAQIVIERDEIPSAPGILNGYYVNDGGLDSVDVGQAGGPQVWDFGRGSTTDSVVEHIVDKDETPFGEEYPEANVVYDTDGIDIAGIDTAAGFLYMKLDEGEMALLGAASENIFGIPLAIVLDSALTMMPLPLKYGVLWSDSTFFLDIFEDLYENPYPNQLFPDPYVDVMVEIAFSTEGQVDGWGTVIVPAGRFEALRVKRHERTFMELSVFLGYGFQPVFDSTQTVFTYDWYVENLGSVASVTNRPGESDPNFSEASRVRRLYRTNAMTNRPPEILSDSTATAVEDRVFLYVARATDPDDDPLSFSFADYASWLSPSDSTISGIPTEGMKDTFFTVIATDDLLSDTLFVGVIVLAVNDPPVIFPLPDTSFVSGDSVVLTLGEYVEDVDSEDSVLVWSAETSAEGLLVTIAGDQALLTAPDFAGTAEVCFTVADDSSASDTDTLLVTVFEPTGVSSADGTEGPENFYLFQNWPNPFNPVTSIQYSVVSDQAPPRVTLKIYNLLGHEVTTLVDELKQPGWHTVIWEAKDGDGKSVPSGVYFSVLQVGRFSSMRKMVFMK